MRPKLFFFYNIHFEKIVLNENSFLFVFPFIKMKEKRNIKWIPSLALCVWFVTTNCGKVHTTQMTILWASHELKFKDHNQFVFLHTSFNAQNPFIAFFNSLFFDHIIYLLRLFLCMCESRRHVFESKRISSLTMVHLMDKHHG